MLQTSVPLEWEGGLFNEFQHTQIGGNRVHSWDVRVSALHMHMHTQGSGPSQSRQKRQSKSSASFDPGFESKSDGTKSNLMGPDR